mgnify:CR=1 FL=1
MLDGSKDAWVGGPEGRLQEAPQQLEAKAAAVSEADGKAEAAEVTKAMREAAEEERDAGGAAWDARTRGAVERWHMAAQRAAQRSQGPRP